MKLETTVGVLTETLDEWFPKRLAASWDNTGLLIGSKKNKVEKILACLTVTFDVCAEATAWGADLIISHHPLMFKPIQQITDESPEGLILQKLCRHGVALYSPHTSHDGCLGGINDQLADLIGMTGLRPLFPAMSPRSVKLVTFVPSSHLREISRELFAAGGGQIGKYSGCSFRGEGVGTFFGEDGTNPVIGTAGNAETVSEHRLEIVFPSQKIHEAISRLKKVHPYEEPAFDIYPLDPTPSREGNGRIGRLNSPTILGQLSQRIAKLAPSELIQSIGHDFLPVTTVAIGCGASGEWVKVAKEQHADLFITGEMRYHDMLWAHQAGMAAIVLGHHSSESFAMKTMVTRLKGKFPETLIRNTSQDHVPMHWYGKQELFTTAE